MSTDRRTFIKYASALLGGSLLAACGVQGPPSAPGGDDDAAAAPIQTPNGFRFHALKREGDLLPDGRRLDHLRFDAVIGDDGQIAYSAFGEDGRVGLYRLQVDATGLAPRILDERPIVREGDLIPGGRATPIGGYHVTGAGTVVFAMETLIDSEAIPNAELLEHVNFDYLDSHGPLLDLHPGPENPDVTYRRNHAIYRADAAQGVQPLVTAGTRTAAGHVILGGFGPAIARGNELLFSAATHFVNPTTGAGDVCEGLWYVADVRAGAETATLVHRTGNFPQGGFGADDLSSDAVIQRFGLFDLQPGGLYCLQAHTALPSRMTTEVDPAGAQSFMGSMLLVGDARRPGSANVLASPTGLGIAPANVRDAIGLGQAAHGPRLSPQGTMGAVLTLANESQRLFYGGRLVAASGDLTPSGESIEAFVTPVFGPQGEMYVVATTTRGFELMLFDGRDLRTLLRSHDTLVGESTPVIALHLGTLIRHVNADTHLVFTAVREDGTSTLVLGLPA
jgi:hypothetical protein